MTEHRGIEIDEECWAAEEIRARSTDPAAYARRCLDRYLWLVDHERPRLRLSQNEAALICEVLREPEHSPSLFWSVAKRVADAIRDHKLDVKWHIDAFELVNKLRGMNLGMILALVDAADRFWQLRTDGTLERLERVGLIH